MAEHFKACKEDGCNGNAAKKGASRGWCGKHYQRWQRHGDPKKTLYFRSAVAMACAVDGCERPVSSKRMCTMHYERQRKHGDPNVGAMRRGKMDWIESNANYAGDDCISWGFSNCPHGRGLITENGLSMSAPRRMCIEAHGKPPTPHHQAAHSCGNGHMGCLNPNHLSWKTARENEADKRVHGTIRRGVDINTSSLTEEDVREIRSCGRATSGVALAQRYGVTATCISQVRTRKTWAWVK